MPTVDERLEELFHEAAAAPSGTDVMTRVSDKRRHRQAVRRVQRVTALTVAVATIVGVGTWTLRDDDSRVAVDQRPASGALAVRVETGAVDRIDRSTGAPVRSEPIVVTPDQGYLRGPVRPSGEYLALAGYDRDGNGFTFPPSRLVRIDARGRVLDRVELQGEVLSLSDGEGARWALTRDAIVNGPQDPEFRVKRIGPGDALGSNAVPPGEQPNGAIVAAGGGVWVPVRDGVLRFDPATGAYAGKIGLPAADRRAVATAGKGVWATSGTSLVRLDPASLRAVPVGGGDPAAGTLVGLAWTQQGGWVLTQGADGDEVVPIRADGTLALARRITLPDGFSAAALDSNGSQAWVTGRADGRTALVVLRDDPAAPDAISSTIVLGPGRDPAPVVMPDGTLVVAVDGRLQRVRLGD